MRNPTKKMAGDARVAALSIPQKHIHVHTALHHMEGITAINFFIYHIGSEEE